jgi:tRNA modification GTPase
LDWDDTIAAIATAVAPGLGSVAIVRLSGPAAESIGRTLFRAPGQQVWGSHRVLYGHVVDPASGERVDEALLLLMKAPRSFTREDVVELHCHGGLIAVQRVLALVLAHGCRRPQPAGRPAGDGGARWRPAAAHHRLAGAAARPAG